MSFAETVADSKEDYESSVTSKWSVSNFVTSRTIVEMRKVVFHRNNSCESSTLRTGEQTRDTLERNQITERNHEA